MGVDSLEMDAAKQTFSSARAAGGNHRNIDRVMNRAAELFTPERSAGIEQTQGRGR